MPARKIKLISAKPMGKDVRLLTLQSDEPIGFVGGKWLMINPGIILEGGKTAKRAYSILSSDREQHIVSIAVKKIPNGPSSNVLHEIKVGEELEYSGPYGKIYHFYENDIVGPVIIAATDTGITAGMGAVNSLRAADFLPHIKMIWMVEGSSYFLSPDFVQTHIPQEIQPSLQIETIQPTGVPERLEKARLVLQKELERRKPKIAFLSGDESILSIWSEQCLIFGLEERNIRKDPFFQSLQKKNR